MGSEVLYLIWNNSSATTMNQIKDDYINTTKGKNVMYEYKDVRWGSTVWGSRSISSKQQLFNVSRMFNKILIL